ncbi:uncharacterized protein ACA1_207960 [Acanthamoeba castellanii str. Neff]|uniref:Uncharacterized protein n=1 Tax=Acanthamoeba castellanii (strain ATCC 30010 / Neff) TaxID=1257118 RepID=L8GXC7_ACACF|nr:uncharacterized protein ACA1_207960 [Acanthamoeba castellanii str. Neff]ELR17929.1 hypothetical protein ACA1_207960 [Acanthamoeba castellanii str. Neff]
MFKGQSYCYWSQMAGPITSYKWIIGCGQCNKQPHHGGRDVNKISNVTAICASLSGVLMPVWLKQEVVVEVEEKQQQLLPIIN